MQREHGASALPPPCMGAAAAALVACMLICVRSLLLLVATDSCGHGHRRRAVSDSGHGGSDHAVDAEEAHDDG